MLRHSPFYFFENFKKILHNVYTLKKQMKKTKEIERMVNTIEKEIERMENNKRLETMVKKIGEWEGDFDSLVNEFDSNDYLFLLENTRFVFGYIIENNIYDAYNDKDWYSFLKLYIKDLLFTHIDEDIMSKTDNLYRLWFETV